MPDPLECLTPGEVAERLGRADRAETWDECTDLVCGDALSTSLAMFTRKAAVLLRGEQEKPLPDMALIGFICDAVRLAREHSLMARRHIPCG
jgi:hypothetical protein